MSTAALLAIFATIVLLLFLALATWRFHPSLVEAQTKQKEANEKKKSMTDASSGEDVDDVDKDVKDVKDVKDIEI